MVGRNKRQSTVKGAKSWLGTLLVAWTFVSGGAVLVGSAYYQRSGEIEVLIAWLAPPFLLGVALFLVMGVVSLVGNTKTTHVEVVNHTGTRQSIFRK